MAEFTIANKKTFAVFLKTRRGQRDVLARERYNIVQYDATDPNAKTYIEGLPVAPTRQAGDGLEVAHEEVFDEIRVYDSPPFLTRLGAVS